MRLETISEYRPFERILKIPKGTILSEKQIKTTESGLKNTKKAREILTDYFERKGKAQDEKALVVDMALEARECFLRNKLYYFDKTQIAKRQEELNRNLQACKKETKEFELRQQLRTVYDWLTVYGK